MRNPLFEKPVKVVGVASCGSNGEGGAVVKVGARDAARLNTLAFGADLSTLQVSDYGWDFLSCVAHDIPARRPDGPAGRTGRLPPRQGARSAGIRRRALRIRC